MRAWQILLGIVLLGGGPPVVARLMVDAPPSWWAPLDGEDAAVQATAEHVEFRLVETVQAIRDTDETWHVRIPDEAVNAWCAARLRSWMRSEPDRGWPEALSVPQVRTTPHRVQVAVHSTDARGPVLSLGIVPDLQDGHLEVHLAGAAAGRLPLPAVPGVLARVVAGLLGEDVVSDPIVLVFDGAWMHAAMITLVDGRRVELLDIRCERGAIIIKARTLPAAVE